MTFKVVALVATGLQQLLRHLFLASRRRGAGQVSGLAYALPEEETWDFLLSSLDGPVPGRQAKRY